MARSPGACGVAAFQALRAIVSRWGVGDVTDIGQPRLVGWKSIAAFVGRDARTAKRWESERRLPVHRAPGGRRPTVWADRDELRSWMEGRVAALPEPGSTPQPSSQDLPRPHRRWLIGGGALALTGAAMAGLGLALRAVPHDPADPYPGDPAARDLWARAQYAASSRTPDGLAAARAAYSTLARQAPKRAAAYVGLAECCLLSREFGTLAESAAYDAAHAFATTAASLDPRSAGALRTLGFVTYWGRSDVVGGLELLRRAVEADPTSARARHWRATAIGARGAWADATAEIDAAARLDPDSTAIQADRALIRYPTDRAAGRAGLEDIARYAPGFSAAHAYLGQIDLIEGRDSDFVAELAAEGRARGDQAATDLARELAGVLSEFGAPAMRRAYAAGQEVLYRAGRLSAFQVAEAWAATGQAGTAVSWLQVCRARGEPSLAATPGAILLNQCLAGQTQFESFRGQV
jgi:tetratricopeptide (TPR) repeat protein